ncbi:putative P450 monooxygenase [Lactarius sanguifluus]|nr:putative P450 monooxygenase [Lactarius sanguifluus]
MVLFSLPGYVTALAAILTYSVWRIVYNLYFHSLSHFPGPKLAACSRLWLAYREIIKGESLSDLRVELHRQYGEIVRLTPNELHFSNPAAYSDIYNQRNKWDKDHLLYSAFNQDTSSFGSIHYSDAKQRRDIIAPFFSRTSILQMQDVIQERVNVLCGALAHQFAAGDIKGKSSDLMLGFQSFGVDVIMAFCYAKNWNTTKVPDFQSDIVIASQVAIAVTTLEQVFEDFSEDDALYEILRNPASLENAPHKTIYHSLLDPDANKGRPLPSRLSLWHEALALFSAGSDTTALAATTISYHVLHNSEIQQRLVNELRTAWPVLEEVPRYEVVEKLPYLASPYTVIKEGLRMFPGGAALPRVVPPEGATIAGIFVPGGTVVAQWFLYVVRSPAVFPDPDAFIPERWLGGDAKTLEASLVSFSKGPRSCIGVNLAYCNLYLVIAGIFRRFDVTLDAKRSGDLAVVEHFEPVFKGPHLHAYWRKRDEAAVR